MRRILLGAGILNQTPLDWQGNLQRITDVISAARRNGVSVLCLPELCLTGYGCEDLFLASHVWQTSWEMLERLIPHTSGLAVTVGLPLKLSDGIYNAVAMIADGTLLGLSLKQNLANDGLHYESRWFRPWPSGSHTEYQSDSGPIVAGDLIYRINGLKIGLEICEDAWVPDRPGYRLARAGVDIILNPSASHSAFGKQALREKLVLDGSKKFSCAYVYANLVGNEAGRAIYDGGGMIADAGMLIAAGPRFSFRPFQLLLASVEIADSHSGRASTSEHSPDDAHQEIAFQFAQPGHDDAVACNGAESRSRPLSKAEEFTRAVALGLFDYQRKSRSNGFVISMSGGADSTACAMLVRAAAEFAFQELTGQQLREMFRYQAWPDSCSGPDDLMRLWLTGVYQGTSNSSETTRFAAEQVTRTAGGLFHEFRIDDLVRGYCEVVEQAIGRRLTWETDDIPLQNIQARTRSPSVWLLANLRGALLLATSNRSEAAVGYTTMDGDTSGGLSPIAGIDKAWLRKWLQILETESVAGFGPFPVLKLVNDQQPTAELRPSEYGQTDEADLMPYEILERIEQLAIRDRCSPGQVLITLQQELSAHSPEQLTDWVVRFFGLWSINQWKRERFAPSFHLDEHNLDPRTWCRFPILSAGYQEELERLQRPSESG